MKPFQKNPSVFGGTEYMADQFEEKVSQSVPKFQDYLSLIVPGASPQLIDLYNHDGQIIYWMHNNPSQFAEMFFNFFKNKKFQEKIKYMVVVSEFQKQITIDEIGIDADKVYVIPNSIDTRPVNLAKFEQVNPIRIINTSTAERGLEVLIKGMALIEDEDIILDVFNDYYPETMGKMTDDKRINFYGKTPKATVMKFLDAAHIHAYPSIYPETFCLSQAEALSAGALCVTSDYGALPEITQGHGIMYPYKADIDKHAEIFATNLKIAISKIRNKEFNPVPQIEYVNNKYSWDAFKQRWIELHDKI